MIFPPPTTVGRTDERALAALGEFYQRSTSATLLVLQPAEPHPPRVYRMPDRAPTPPCQQGSPLSWRTVNRRVNP